MSWQPRLDLLQRPGHACRQDQVVLGFVPAQRSHSPARGEEAGCGCSVPLVQNGGHHEVGVGIVLADRAQQFECGRPGWIGHCSTVPGARRTAHPVGGARAFAGRLDEAEADGRRGRADEHLVARRPRSARGEIQGPSATTAPLNPKPVVAHHGPCPAAVDEAVDTDGGWSRGSASPTLLFGASDGSPDCATARPPSSTSRVAMSSPAPVTAACEQVAGRVVGPHGLRHGAEHGPVSMPVRAEGGGAGHVVAMPDGVLHGCRAAPCGQGGRSAG